jgi:Carboxypeptidase regulatory-like domain/TonB-dependent Receptor Plug Domain
MRCSGLPCFSRTTAGYAVGALVAAFMLSLLPALAAGGLVGNLKGTIVDSATKTPIAGAQITAVSGSGKFRATTDAKGFFIILGMAVDSYNVTVAAPGHMTVNIPGVTVFGDETDTIGTVALATQLKTIAEVTSRSTSSAFQPTQTTDSYTVNQQQILQSTGKTFTTNENAALLAVPGVTLTNNNSAISSTVTIRGGAAAEVGYQFDGVPFKEPFEGDNGSDGLMNGIGSIQVVEGAGDATQGGVGAGVINVIPERGSGPGSGTLDLEAGGPSFNHQVGLDYGFSTPNGRVSEYVSYTGQRYAPYYGYSYTPLNQYGNYFAPTYVMNDQFVNNFFYRFGKQLSQQVQVLYMNTSQQAYEGTSGPGGVYTGTLLFDPSDGLYDIYNGGTNPNALAYYPYDMLTQGFWVAGMGYTPAQYESLVPLGNGVPSTNVAIRSPQQAFSNQTRFLKLEYDNNLTPTTYMALRYYNWELLEYSDDQYSQGPWGSQDPGITDWSVDGGSTVGTNLDIEHQFGSNLTVTVSGQYNLLHPIFDDEEPQDLLSALITGTGLSLTPDGSSSTTYGQPVPTDWLPGGYLCGNNTNGPGGTGVDYLKCAASGSVADTRIPMWGIGYNGTFFQEWGGGIRFQYNPNDHLKLDIGIRDEGQNVHYFGQLDQYGQGVPSTGYVVVGCAAYAANPLNYAQCPTTAINNPYDIPSQLYTILHPTALQPRAAISWQLGRDNSLRFGYGRSAVFWNGVTSATPFHLYGITPYLNIPAKPGSVCGWTDSAVFPCATYAQQLYWMGDNEEAPDVNTGPPADYSNYDLSFNHLFKNNWGLRVTPFIKEGTNLPADYLLNPVLGIFATANLGSNKTAGVELGVTTPQVKQGISGFFTATYQNVLSTTPPFTTGETEVPLDPIASLELGDLYRAGYVSPFSIRIGGVDNLKNGLHVSPQLEYNIGYPYSVGNMIAACVIPYSGIVVSLSAPGCSRYANVPQVDFGPGITGGESSLVGDAPGASVSTNYYDPAYPGVSTNPNIAATRGTPGTAANGGILSHPNLEGDLSLEWTHNQNTFGIQFLNLFGNAWINAVPAINPWYQPVATGLSGPQTGYNSCVSQTGTTRGCYPYIARDSYAFTNGAYVLSNGNFTGTPTFGPIQPFTVQVYYQRAL